MYVPGGSRGPRLARDLHYAAATPDSAELFPRRLSACLAFTAKARGIAVANMRLGLIRRVPTASNIAATLGSRAAAAYSAFSPEEIGRPVA